MSPAAAKLLVDEIYPIIKKTIPRTVKPIGSEDSAELIQDAITSAAMMLDSAEKNGKALPSFRSVAYYSIQRSKIGRRSYGDNRSDVLSAGFLLQNEGRVFSLDLSLGEEATQDDSFSLHDMLADKRDDAGELCAKKLDWETFLKKQPKIIRRIIEAVSMGVKNQDIAAKHGVSAARISQIKRDIAESIKEFMGEDILLYVMEENIWKRDLRCLREKDEWKHLHFTDDVRTSPAKATEEL